MSNNHQVEIDDRNKLIDAFDDLQEFNEKDPDHATGPNTVSWELECKVAVEEENVRRKKLSFYYYLKGKLGLK